MTGLSSRIGYKIFRSLLIKPPSRGSVIGLFALFFNCPRLTASFNLTISDPSARLTSCFVSGQQRMARRSLSILTGRLSSVRSAIASPFCESIRLHAYTIDYRTHRDQVLGTDPLLIGGFCYSTRLATSF